MGLTDGLLVVYFAQFSMKASAYKHKKNHGKTFRLLCNIKIVIKIQSFDSTMKLNAILVSQYTQEKLLNLFVIARLEITFSDFRILLSSFTIAV